ncbi:glucose-methanol-choline oxidoreductase [Bradyrhizobium sp. NAS80.1]|uniref:GMC family oxidoreductase n=1 Tax=Bradyrhizobium sp. NAS80.1 TaxID=1680159 RepID=UPI00095DA1A5|nr:GMC family oxidoreductase [Bradyrhizobium sp. NAS80.1]OKO82298.1 glucose-methanol-choline oxidoreductase [Bradyrhizobium sp. NAS80.1]
MKVDTVIVGSGVVAAALSQRLLELDPNASILILEAGERVKTKDFGLWQHYLVTGRLPYEPNRDLDYPQRDAPGENSSIGRTTMPLQGARLFNYGGSTMHWGGWSFRLKPEDFRLRTNTGQGADWPISYDDLEPYYGKAENYLAVSGDSSDTTVPRSTPYPFAAFPLTLQDQPLAQACETLKISYAKLPIARRGVSATPSRHAPCQTTGTCKYCPFGARYVASNYIDDMRAWNDYRNFEVRLGAAVERIVMGDKRTAAAVEYIDRDTGDIVRVEAGRIVIAAGTIESAKLLLRSTGADWPTGVGNAGDQVGRNLVTHPYFVFTGSLPKNPLKLQPEMDFPTFVSRHYDSPAEQPAGKFMFINPPDTVPVALAAKMQAGFNRAELDAYVAGPLPLQIHGMVEVFGRFENRVTNIAQRNHLGLWQTAVDYSADPGFLARMATIKAELQRIYIAMGATLTDDATISWRADHAGSTCRMSNEAKDGVVDPTLRVHGTDNLYVCSNAVFPAIGSINPTLTVTALALRLADQLAGARAP